MAPTLDTLPAEVLAHILSLVPPTSACETLGGLEFFLLVPPPGAPSETGAGAAAAADPAAHDSATPRIATPAGARELAALSVTCKVRRCGLTLGYHT